MLTDVEPVADIFNASGRELGADKSKELDGSLSVTI